MMKEMRAGNKRCGTVSTDDGVSRTIELSLEIGDGEGDAKEVDGIAGPG